MQEDSQHNEETVDSDISNQSIITVGPITVDASQNAVIIDGKLWRLTPRECKVLHFLAVHANTICTSSQIFSHVWGYNDSDGTGLVKHKIRRIRSVIEPHPNHPIYILTVPDVGYILMSHDHDESI